MSRKASLDPDCNGNGQGTRVCQKCSGYDHCDGCGRGLCKYVSVNCDPLGTESQLLCPDCYKSNLNVYFYGEGLVEGAAHSSQELYNRWIEEVR